MESTYARINDSRTGPSSETHPDAQTRFAAVRALLNAEVELYDQLWECSSYVPDFAMTEIAKTRVNAG